ncbi:adenosylcobalamin-dependent ribonucleoside-diphosphate reductase [Roseovarius sp. CAU 1744]|uniref:adenosylcobalamin-dependent ribonucleoside-diphosphate reductase n=1 Tax=Roseovarius sp. CAU 1744 TaxID=3140368 RepID=UPI00325BD38C
MLHHSDVAFAAAAFDQPIAEHIWRSKYQYKTQGRDIDHTVNDTWRRVADSLSRCERSEAQQATAGIFYRAMEDFRLIPAGRILSGAGTRRHVSLCNTFVMRAIPDSVAGIMDTIKEAALTMQMGGGIGFDFSTLRPQGNLVKGLDCPAAGPLAAMDICDAVCRMLVTGMGRGAMMATMRCDHPDIEAFVAAKSDPARMRNFNLSVMVTDLFMRAVDADTDWDLVWQGRRVRSIKARALWQAIMQRAYDTAEPGVLFIDRINAANPLGYLETISATNSCAEQPLPPNGNCPLASINLARLVKSPFRPDARMDRDEMRRLAAAAVRLLDNVIETSRFALDAQRAEATRKRRIGVGVTGVADALIMLGVRYGTPEAAKLVGTWMRTIQNAAYLASAELAADRGAFPSYDAQQHQARAGIRALDAPVRRAIAAHGLRNGVLTTIAPTGTISMFGGNVSSGIEPVFATSFRRKITRPDGTISEELVEDYAALLFRKTFGRDAPLPHAFVTVQDLRPEEHVRMQAAAQRWVDSGISKTVNCPENIPFAAFEDVYLQAFEAGCKGCTTYRPNAITGSVLSS